MSPNSVIFSQYRLRFVDLRIAIIVMRVVTRDCRVSRRVLVNARDVSGEGSDDSFTAYFAERRKLCLLPEDRIESVRFPSKGMPLYEFQLVLENSHFLFDALSTNKRMTVDDGLYKQVRTCSCMRHVRFSSPNTLLNVFVIF